MLFAEYKQKYRIQLPGHWALIVLFLGLDFVWSELNCFLCFTFGSYVFIRFNYLDFYLISWDYFKDLPSELK